MNALNVLVRMPARWLVPLMLAALALLASSVNYAVQIRSQKAALVQAAEQLLLERLSPEQHRLDVESGMGNSLLVGRLVTGLGLFQGLDQAYLVKADGQIAASLSRTDLGRSFSELTGQRQMLFQPLLGTNHPSIQTRYVSEQTRLLGSLPVQDGSRLLVSVDLSQALAEQVYVVRKNLLRRVAERTEQLSVANRELEAFSYSVSHDLKAPLRGIDGYSQLLVDEYSDGLGDEGRQFVLNIRQGVRQMGELINDLLEYSRMERRDMAAEPLALRPLIEKILDGYHADIQKQGTQVRLSMEAFTLPLDREGISVVLRNLIGNALKFSREASEPAIEIGGRSEAGHRILWVRDNGVGFDMKYHDRIFGIFQRLHRSEAFPGTGVGLALVAKAVQRMGGRVWAESAPGAGATFYLEFPA